MRRLAVMPTGPWRLASGVAKTRAHGKEMGRYNREYSRTTAKQKRERLHPWPFPPMKGRRNLPGVGPSL